MGDSALLKASYDALPYETRARRKTHPDTMATLGRLFGLQPPPVESARVLEIGCGTGENLLAIADTLPDATCFGIDISERQIDLARATSHAAGIANATFCVGDFSDLSDSAQSFDYVIAHGVLSWIPPDRHDDLFAACSRCLAPGGLLYLSYNALPGWHLRKVIRDYLLGQTTNETTAAGRVAAARKALAALADTTAGLDSAYGRLIADEKANVDKLGDSYVAHDLLETFNTSFYFDDVVRRASGQDLHYLAEAAFEAMVPDTYPPSIADALRRIPDLRQREQYLDFLINRTFRESIFSRSALAAGQPQQRAIAALYLSSPVHRTGRQAEDGGALFSDPAGREISLAPGIALEILDVLSRRFPEAVTLGELLGMLNRPVAKEELVALVNTIFVAFSRGFIYLNTARPRVAARVRESARAPRLARTQVLHGRRVTTCLMDNIELDDPDCATLMPLLDGSRDRAALAAALSAEDRQAGMERVDEALGKLARVGLLLSDETP